MSKHLIGYRTAAYKQARAMLRCYGATAKSAHAVALRSSWSFGLLFNRHALWLGVHYSSHTKRWCINLLPTLTVWVRRPGGQEPEGVPCP